jgi:hypothetical protein
VLLGGGADAVGEPPVAGRQFGPVAPLLQLGGERELEVEQEAVRDAQLRDGRAGTERPDRRGQLVPASAGAARVRIGLDEDAARGHRLVMPPLWPAWWTATAALVTEFQDHINKIECCVL